jgi:hypothetical protein
MTKLPQVALKISRFFEANHAFRRSAVRHTRAGIGFAIGWSPEQQEL